MYEATFGHPCRRPLAELTGDDNVRREQDQVTHRELEGVCPRDNELDSCRRWPTW